MTQNNEYSGAGRDLLVKAREELAQGDVRQASEKGWGAAAQMLKAVAEQRGWEHNGQALLYQAVRRMVQETGTPSWPHYSTLPAAFTATSTRTGYPSSWSSLALRMLGSWSTSWRDFFSDFQRAHLPCPSQDGLETTCFPSPNCVPPPAKAWHTLGPSPTSKTPRCSPPPTET